MSLGTFCTDESADDDDYGDNYVGTCSSSRVGDGS